MQNRIFLIGYLIGAVTMYIANEPKTRFAFHEERPVTVNAKQVIEIKHGHLQTWRIRPYAVRQNSGPLASWDTAPEHADENSWSIFFADGTILVGREISTHPPSLMP